MYRFSALFIVCFLLMQAPAGAETVKLADFRELMEALQNGGNVRVVIHYGGCRLIADNEEKKKSPDAIGGMPLDTYEYFAKGSVKNDEAFLSASQAKLIANPKGRGHVYNYIKIKIWESGAVQVVAQYLDPRTFEVQMNASFYSTLNGGAKGGQVYLFCNR